MSSIPSKTKFLRVECVKHGNDQILAFRQITIDSYVHEFRDYFPLNSWVKNSGYKFKNTARSINEARSSSREIHASACHFNSPEKV